MEKNLLKLIIVLLCFSSSNMQAQSYQVNWQKNYGGSAKDVAFSIATTTDGGTISAGQTASADFDVTLNQGGEDIWVVKTDSAGNIQWQKSYGGTLNDDAYYISQTADHGYIITGSSNSNNGDFTVNKGGTDVFLLKLDSTGTILWQKTYGGSLDDFGVAAIPTSDGGYIIGASTSSNDSDVTFNNGSIDAWLIKTDATGNMQWQKTYGSYSYDFANAMIQTTDGGFMICGGASANSGNVSGFHGGSGDAWLFKTDSAGTIQWQKCFGGSQWDTGIDIINTLDGGYSVCGETFSTNGDVVGNHGGGDLWVFKIDTTGTLIWQNPLGGTAEEYGNHIIQTPDSNYVIAATTSSINGNVTFNNGGKDGWIVTLDKKGKLVGQFTMGGTLDDEQNSIVQDVNGAITVVGYSKSNNGTLTANNGAEDFWLVKFSNLTVGISENTVDANGLSVYPNPVTSGNIVVSFNADKNSEIIISVFDIAGKIISQQKENIVAGNNNLVINCSNLSSGSYIVNINNGEKSINSKLIVR